MKSSHSQKKLSFPTGYVGWMYIRRAWRSNAAIRREHLVSFSDVLNLTRTAVIGVYVNHYASNISSLSASCMDI